MSGEVTGVRVSLTRGDPLILLLWGRVNEFEEEVSSRYCLAELLLLFLLHLFVTFTCLYCTEQLLCNYRAIVCKGLLCLFSCSHFCVTYRRNTYCNLLYRSVCSSLVTKEIYGRY